MHYTGMVASNCLSQTSKSVVASFWNLTWLPWLLILLTRPSLRHVTHWFKRQCCTVINYLTLITDRWKLKCRLPSWNCLPCVFTHLRTCSNPVPPQAFGGNICSPFPLLLEVISLYSLVQVMDFIWVLLIENNFTFCNFYNVICLVSLMHTFGWIAVGFLMKVVLSS